MKSKFKIVAASAVLVLLTAASNVNAEPAEACTVDGIQGYSQEQIGSRTGWHLWECQQGHWQYVHFCGRFPC